MPIPKTALPLRTKIEDQSILIYGEPKVGKSTFSAAANKAIMLGTEDGLKHQSCHQWYAKDRDDPGVKSWEHMLIACAEIAKGDHDCKTVVIDTIDNAYRLCDEYICRKNGVDHVADVKGFGKGYGSLNAEFHRVLTKLSMLPYGLILVSHSKTIEEDTRTGKVTNTVPTLPGKAREISLGLVDIILYAAKKTDDKGKVHRIMHTQPGAGFEAGDRTGRLPPMLPLNYAKFLKAYNDGKK